MRTRAWRRFQSLKRKNRKLFSEKKCRERYSFKDKIDRQIQKSGKSNKDIWKELESF